jgi:mRNA export factor
VDLPERVYAMDQSGPLLVVGTANQQVLLYNLASNDPRHADLVPSPLRYQTRSIACFPNAQGFAISSIEGRVGLFYLNNNERRYGILSVSSSNDPAANSQQEFFIQMPQRSE